MTKKSKKTHVIFNHKRFLAPKSLTSMAAIHCKIKPCGEAQIRISDCNRTIKIYNDMNDLVQVAEMLCKINNMIACLEEFRDEVRVKNPNLI